MRSPVAYILIVGFVQMGLCFSAAGFAFWMARWYQGQADGYDGIELVPSIVQRYARWYAKRFPSSTTYRRGAVPKPFLRFGVKFLKVNAYGWILGGIIFEIDMVIRLYILFAYTR